jgi:hypothetical protein
MLNNSSTPNAELVYEDNGDISVRVVPGHVIKHGEQLFISYGDQLTSGASLARYGFVAPLHTSSASSAPLDNVAIPVPLVCVFIHSSLRCKHWL